MIAFHLFGRPIYRYGIFYFISFIIGYLFLVFLSKKGYFRQYPMLQNILSHHLETLLTFLILGVIVGGRLGYILIYRLPYYLEHLSEIFEVWKGGMSFIGGGLGLITSMFIFRHKYKLSWREFFLLFDCLFVIVPLGIFFGRLGNYLNQELYGIAIQNVCFGGWCLPSQVIEALKNIGIAHVYPLVDDILRVNTNALSMVFEGIVLLIIEVSLFVKQIKKLIFQPGKITAIFLIWYSFVRFRLEYLRQDSQSEFIGIFTRSQWVFIVSFLVGVGIMVFMKKKKCLKGLKKND
ncbi:prolipoprotein diacylglyceryl transferase [candidate division SR1 bacterium]|nr:prolipoprotein diacylglyceryl transferase [candidate division SR1 bacterium]